ncbi:MAG: hypothetical protein AB8I69_08710, partial [Anaerolineae bacterium]
TASVRRGASFSDSSSTIGSVLDKTIHSDYVLYDCTDCGTLKPRVADKYTNTIDIFKKSEAIQPFFKSAYG